MKGLKLLLEALRLSRGRCEGDFVGVLGGIDGWEELKLLIEPGVEGACPGVVGAVVEGSSV